MNSCLVIWLCVSIVNIDHYHKNDVFLKYNLHIYIYIYMAISSVHIELMKFFLVNQHWCVHVLESIVYELAPSSPAMPTTSCSSHLDGLWDFLIYQTVLNDWFISISLSPPSLSPPLSLSLYIYMYIYVL